jgi:hypothetical protein
MVGGGLLLYLSCGTRSDEDKEGARRAPPSFFDPCVATTASHVPQISISSHRL